MSKVTIKEAMDALAGLQKILDEPAKALNKEQAAKDWETLAQFTAEKAWAAAPKSNTGLPCPYCGEPLEKLFNNNDDGTTTVRIHAKLTKRGFGELLGLLKMFEKE